MQSLWMKTLIFTVIEDSALLVWFYVVSSNGVRIMAMLSFKFM